MSDENKIEETKVEVKARGERGVVGQPTPALTVKQAWHREHFRQVSVKDAKGEHIKYRLEPLSGAPSLKQFAHALGSQEAKDWFAHKKGSLNAKRSDANIRAASEARAATKMKKRKKGDGGSK